MSITLDTVESMAPDQASVKAANKLLKPSKWPLLGIDSSRQIIWGECQGSGANPYRISIAMDDLGYKCSCPSRKFPCKHVLCVMWQYAETAGAFQESQAPEWVEDWLSRRRGPKKGAAGEDDKAKPKVSVFAARMVVEEKPEDPKVLERKRAQAEKRKAERESSILDGLEELESWLSDQISSGLGGFSSVARERCRLAGQRLVDAKAPGLASWVDELPSRYFNMKEELRPDFLIEEFGKLYLLIEAYRKQESLPDDLREDVRRIAGWSLKRDELLEERRAVRVSGNWMVLKVLEEIQADQLRRYETWLWNIDEADHAFAVLIDFVPFAVGKAVPPFVQGEMFQGEVVYYPSAVPLRAVINERQAIEQEINPVDIDWAKQGQSLVDALDRFRDQVSIQPWVNRFPLLIGGVQVVRSKDGEFWVADDRREHGVPLSNRDVHGLVPLTAVGTVDCIGLWDGKYFEALAMKSEWGCWYSSQN